MAMKNTQKIHVSSPDAAHRVDRSLIKSTAQLLLMRFLLPLLLLLGATLPAQASHFRYGTVSWEPTATTGQVKFTIVDAFRRSAYTGTASDGRPAIGNIITENTGATSFSFGDGGNTGTLQYIVTAIDTAEDFLIGEALNPGTSSRGVLHTYSGAGPFTAQISSAARISALNNRSGGSYVLTTTVRPLSGNSSPKSSLSPVVVVPQLAAASFLVPGADANGDGLRWRLSTDAEAGGGASPSNLSVNANTGLVTWNNVGLNTTNPWTVQIIIEDLDTSGNVKSQTPVDFLMEIDPNAAGNPPVVTINPSGPVTILPGNPVSFSVSSTDPDASSTVSLNASGLPGGSTMTPTLPVSGSGATGVNSTFNWTPSASQTGSFPIVFTATDNTGRQTSASKTITVSTATPPAVAAGAAPTTTFTTAVINASVNPNGTPTSIRFEYGTSTSYGNSTTPQSIGNGTSPVAVSANLNGLLSGTTYNYRLVASNAGGTTNGPNQTFTTDRARLTAVAISSNGINPAYARIGQTVSLSFTANTPIQTPTVLIAGKAASVSGAGTSWSATVTVDATYNEGVAPFSIVFNDAAGNPGLTATATTNGSSVTIDRTAPVLTLPGTQNVTVNTANGAQVLYAPATATDLTPVVITYSRPSGSVFQIGQTTVTVTATDAAGNASTGTILVVATLQIATPPLVPGGSAPFISEGV